MLRSAALADERVIELVNHDFVPVWINVRTTPLPRLPFVDEVLVNARLDDRHFVADPFSQGFFVRSVVVSADGQRLLNPAARTVAASMKKVMLEGDLSYAVVDPGDYLVMLRKALARHRRSD